MMMMPLGKQTSNITDSSLNTPPPKPNRINQNFSIVDFSPTHASTINKASYLLKKNSNLNGSKEAVTSFDDNISAIILNRDEVEKCNIAPNALNSQSPTYGFTVRASRIFLLSLIIIARINNLFS